VDGKLRTFSDTDDKPGSWWRVDLGKPAMIHKIRWYCHEHANRDIGNDVRVGMSTNINRMQICGVLQQKDKKKYGNYYAYDITCMTGLKGRYVQANNNANRISLAIREFYVYGYYI
jgi:hypothetical protein